MKYRRLIWLVSILLGTVYGACAHATDFTISVGPSWTKGGRTTEALFVTALGDERRLGLLEWQPQFDVGAVRSHHSALRDLDRTVWVAAAGARLPHLWENLFFSFQFAAVQPRTSALSSTQQFVSSLGWQQGCVTVVTRHISNGSTHEPNDGESMLLLGVGL